MARQYGYFYDENGKFTDYRLLEEKPIYEKRNFEREEQKEIVTEEKLCALHQSIEDGTYKPNIDEETGEELPVISKYDCPDCVMRSVEYETVQVPYEEDVVIGYEPDIPPNCTLEVCPWLGYDPVFNGKVWLKTKEPEPTPEPIPEPDEVELLRDELKVTKAALADFIMQQALREGL